MLQPLHFDIFVHISNILQTR